MFDFQSAPANLQDRATFDGAIGSDAILRSIDAAVAEHGPRADAVDLWRRPQDAMTAIRLVQDGRLNLRGRKSLDGKDFCRVDADFTKAIAESRVDAVEPMGADFRADAPFAAGGGPFALRQLEYVMAKVLEEKHKIPSAIATFPINGEVPIGAREYTIRMTTSQGEATYIRGGNMPMVQGGQSTLKELQRRVHYIGTNVKMNVFDTLTAGFANVDLFARNMRGARRAYEELVNRSAWYGDTGSDLWGILNYPSLPKVTINTAFDGTASADAVVTALSKMLAYARNVSGGAFGSDAVAVSLAFDTYVRNTRMSGYNDTTIWEFFFKRNHPEVKYSVHWELSGVGPGGLDGMFWYKDDPEAVALVMVQGLTPLPVQYVGYDQLTPMYAGYGGVQMPFVGNNFLGWVKTASNNPNVN